MMNGGWNKTLKTQVIFLTKKNQTFIYVIVYSLYLILKFLATRQNG